MPLNDEQVERLRDMLEQIEPETKKLNDWERGFFNDQHERFEKYGADIFLSPKQWQKLGDIYEKATGHAYGQGPVVPPDIDDEIPF